MLKAKNKQVDLMMIWHIINIKFKYYINNYKILYTNLILNKYRTMYLIVSPVRSTYGGYYGLVVVTPRPPRPRPQTLHRSHDNLKNPYRIASIFYM